MADITTRETSGGGATVKGSPLTNAEVDTNFINLQTDKIELTDISVAAEPDPSGDGSLSYNNTTGVLTYTPPADISGAVTFNAQAGEALSKGDVVYVSGVSGNTPVVSKADADDASKMPAFGLAEADANLNAAVNVVTFGTLYDLDTSAFSAGDTVYVSTTAGAITDTAPTGESSLLQNIGKVIRSHASAGSIKVGGAGRTNATPNLNDGNVFIGNASNQAEARALTGDDISGGTITSFASTGIDDNATGERLTITDSGIAIGNTGTNPTPINGTTAVHATASSGAEFIAGTNDTVISSGAFMGGYVFRNADSTGSPPHYSGMWAESADTSGNMNLYFAAGSTGYETGSADLTIDSSGNTTFAGTITSGDITISEGTPFLRIQDTDGTDQYTQLTNGNGNTYFGSRDDTADGNILIGGYGGGSFTEFARWAASGHLTQKNNLIVQGTFTSLGIDDNATSTAITINASEQVGIGETSPSRTLDIKGANPLNINTTSNNHIHFQVNDVTTGQYVSTSSLPHQLCDSTGSVPRLVVDSNGRVGIGVTPFSAGGNGDDLIIGDPTTSVGSGITIGSTTTGDIQFGDANTGTGRYAGLLRYEHANDAMVFWTASAERMRIDSIGRVGIGTTDPSTYSNASELVVDTGLAGGITVVSDSTSGGYGGLYFADGTTGDEQYRGFFQYNHNNSGTDEMLIGTAGTTRVTIDSDGYTGIGTTDPETRLHVAEANSGATIEVARFSNSQMSSSFSAGAKISIGDDSLASRQLELSLEGNGSSEFYAYVRTTEPSGPLFLGTATVAEAVTVASNGNVGIGTTSPDANLEIRKDNASGLGAVLSLTNSNVSGRTGNSVAIGLSAYTDTTIDSASYRGAIIRGETTAAGNGHSILFETSDTSAVPVERVRIDHDGNLLVGRDSGIGNERLAVKSTALTCTFYSANSTANGTLMSYYSDVGGTEQQVAAMQRDGDIANTNNSYGALSDERLKSNIVDASSQIDDIMAVQVRSYTLDSTGDTHIGVVAQELEASGMSGLVKENEDGMKSVKYSVLYMKAIKALQEAVTRIETLEAEVTALKGA